jgi:hypothetical protein
MQLWTKAASGLPTANCPTLEKAVSVYELTLAAKGFPAGDTTL